MAIRVSDRVQKSDERRLVPEGTRKGRYARRNCCGQFGTRPPYDLVVYFCVKALKAPLMVVGPWRIFRGKRKESYWKKSQNATNSSVDTNGRNEAFILKTHLKFETMNIFRYNKNKQLRISFSVLLFRLIDV